MIRRSYIADQNPNFKNAGWKVCSLCNGAYHNYNKTRKYCSSKCYVTDQKERISALAIVASKQLKKPRVKLGYKLVCVVCDLSFRSFTRSKYCANHKAEAEINKVSKIKLGKPVDPDKKETKICLQCKKQFEHYKSRQKLYCSYECHLDSGGAWRAGLASKKVVMKYGAKKDANHFEIVDALKKAGAYVLDMSHVGSGFPDLIVGAHQKTMLVEIKNPKTAYGKKGLNKNQQKWKEQWVGGPYCIVDSIEGATRAVNSLADLDPHTNEKTP